MSRLPCRIKREFEHKRIAKTSTAVAGLAAAASAGVGVVAAAAAPKGLAALGVALKISSAPLLVTAAPVAAGVAVAVGTSAGLIRFYSWYRERAEEAALAEEEKALDREAPLLLE
ncbi:hypothetical protein OOT00_12480 [Desulfobotulus sp. H1]|uniref:Uncharacterized protein n=1 Tax=Desulfobotulus pelophilus TaxID=2823377 RepID=A0ABT3NBF9_9BACT|nr:hypothetical protein [Desulfobotulus pelophilus]MCW7754799.1 hypothetical protein [Desulfobotulus pelophilus]